jgi:uncharacterized membrane protein
MNKKQLLLGAAMAGILSIGTFGRADEAKPAAPKGKKKAEKVHCYGVNKCAGKGKCATAGLNECAGKNSCKGKGYLELTKGMCSKKKGSTEAPKSTPAPAQKG